MRNTILALLFAAPITAWSQLATVNSFDDIQYWTGSGTNQAALLLQWNDGVAPVSLAWGFRWNNEATGLDMLRAIAGSTVVTDPAGDLVDSGLGADKRLRLGLIEYSFGLSVFSIDYEPSSDPQRTQADWYGGYWEYLIRGGHFEYGGIVKSTYNIEGSDLYSFADWTSAPVGAGDRPLIDGAWDAYSFAPGSATVAVQQPTAAPLPVPAAVCSIGQDGRPAVSAIGKTGFSYRLEYSENPAGPWNPMGPSEPGTGGLIVFVDETAVRPPQRFYRIAVTQTP